MPLPLMDMKRILYAIQFLTIIPIRTGAAVNEAEIAKSSSAFVLVGLAQGLLLLATGYIAGMVLDPDITTVIILLMLSLSNGGFHLDGLADTFDGIAVKSGGDVEKDREKRLSVMRDGTTGPAGVIAIVFMILLKYLAINNLTHHLMFTYYYCLLMMPVVSKWAMVISIFYGKPAREDGLGRLFIGRIGHGELVISTLTLVILLILPQFFGSNISEGKHILYIVFSLFIYILSRLWVSLCHRRFGGLTGDTLGAIGEITELSFLLMVLVWSRLFI